MSTRFARKGEGAASLWSALPLRFFVIRARYPTMTNFPRKASRPPQPVPEPDDALFALA